MKTPILPSLNEVGKSLTNFILALSASFLSSTFSQSEIQATSFPGNQADAIIPTLKKAPAGILTN